MENSNSRIIYADLLRIIATFAVIVLHVSASKWYDIPVKDFNTKRNPQALPVVRQCVLHGQ